MMIDQYHPCPICNKPVQHWDRYPHAVCHQCSKKACDIHGQPLTFGNICAGGGFRAVYTNTHTEYPSHTCYIEGIECRADEARFGGIVVEAVNQSIRFHESSKFYGCFSSFAPYAIFLKGKIWPSVEHYFQAQKCADTPSEEVIRQAKTAREAAKIGRDRPLRQDWETVKDQVMREALHAKFTQHPNLKEKLQITGDRPLILHREKGPYWSDGNDGTGHNRLGKLLMEIRDLS